MSTPGGHLLGMRESLGHATALNALNLFTRPFTLMQLIRSEKAHLKPTLRVRSDCGERFQYLPRFTLIPVDTDLYPRLQSGNSIVQGALLAYTLGHHGQHIVLSKGQWRMRST